MPHLADAHKNGFDQCLADLGIEKTAFLGGAIKGAWKGLKSGSQAIGLTGSKKVRTLAAAEKPLIRKFKPKMQGYQTFKNRKQFMKGNDVMQKGLINGMRTSTKIGLGGSAAIMGAGQVANSLHQAAGGNRAVLNRPMSRRTPGSNYYRR